MPPATCVDGVRTDALLLLAGLVQTGRMGGCDISCGRRESTGTVYGKKPMSH